MPLSLAAHFALIEDEYAALLERPLSARRTRLVTQLIDAFADRAFAAWWETPERVFGAEDPLRYRAAVADRSEPMRKVFAIAGGEAARLSVKAVVVPIEAYAGLAVQDRMVSLYNGNTVQRVMIVGDGVEREALPVLGAAIAWWRPLL